MHGVIAEFQFSVQTSTRSSDVPATIIQSCRLHCLYQRLIDYRLTILTVLLLLAESARPSIAFPHTVDCPREDRSTLQYLRGVGRAVRFIKYTFIMS